MMLLTDQTRNEHISPVTHNSTGLLGSAMLDCTRSCKTLPLRNFTHTESASVTVPKGLASSCPSFCVTFTRSPDFISHGAQRDCESKRVVSLPPGETVYLHDSLEEARVQPRTLTPRSLCSIPLCTSSASLEQKPKDQMNDCISC